LRVALRIEVPSLEGQLVAEALGKAGPVDVLDPWDARSHSEKYDLAVCVGPVRGCPLARRRMLLVLGPTSWHSKRADWDDVVVTSPAAVRNAVRHFGHGPRFYLNPPPLLAMEAGRRRLMKRRVIGLCASPGGEQEGGPAVIEMALWSLPEGRQVPFSAMEFNSLCLNGAYGVYRKMGDGYDVQVRRHLALGSPVLAPRDEGVLGDLAERCLENFDGHSIPVEPVEDKVSIEGYVEALKEVIRRK